MADVEAQLSAIRSRRNGLAAQRALAVALGTPLIAAALVVATALRGSATVFAVATAAAAIATGAAIAAAAWYARREWLSLPATARLADASAQLDERLTTLLAVAPLAPAPTLRPLLVRQVLGARHQWDLAALAPQRLSGWLMLVPLGLLVLAATAFYARPPAVAGLRTTVAKSSPLETHPLAGAEVVERSATDRGTSAAGDQILALAGTSRRDGERDRAQRAAAAGADTASASMPAAGSDAAGAADDSIETGSPAAGDHLADLRQSIRAAFGAAPESDLGMSPAASSQRAGTGGDSNAERHRADDARSDTNGTGTSGNKDQPADANAAGTQSVTPGADPSADEQGAKGSGRGGAGATGSTGVLGAAGSPRLESDPAAPMAIKIAAISGVSPSQTEPQRRHQGVTTSAAANASRTAPLPDLASEQLADATMQQLEVGPEHEAIVRRLFTRE
ncbi:hypothetical protein KF840_00705 [bacterium]|nr:hypothetical protein [bacterium]